MKLRYLSSLAAVVFAALVYGPDPALAQTAPPLGVFQQFGLLGAQGVTANGTTVVNGDVGSCPTPSITGAGLSTVPPFTIHLAADGVTCQAQIDATAAGLNLSGQGPGTLLVAGLGGTAVGPGVYSFTTTADIAASTNFTLNGPGVYIFIVPTSLTANVLSTVTLNGVNPCQVFWRVGSAATLNGVNFPGTVIATAAVSLGNGMNLQGRAASLTAAITAAATGQTIGGCSIAPGGCPVITLAPPTLPAGALGVAYSQQITASGGTGPYTFTVASGTLPAGLTLSSSGLLAGTPTANGSSTVVIQANDANGCPGVATYTINIGAVVPTLPQAFLLLLALLLIGAGYFQLRRRAQGA